MKVMAAVVSLICAAGTANAEAYLCVADGATGFRYNSDARAWEIEQVNVQKRRHVINKRDGAWHWIVMANNDFNSCDKGFSDSGIITCGSVTNYVFSRKTMRYQVNPTMASTVFERGTRYANEPAYIEIGSCVEI